MSSNGAGRISSEIKSGKRPKEDTRNRLILPGIEILESLQPEWFILENVRRMENTVIRNEKDVPENILQCLNRRLGGLGYSIFANILDFRDYGVPHHRERLITVGCRIPHLCRKFPSGSDIFSKELSPFHPLPSHGQNGQRSWVSLREAIQHLPSLDAKTETVNQKDDFHCVPKWNEQQYFWMQHTPEGQSAFDNIHCIKCNRKIEDPTAVSCVCGEALPRPQIKDCGKYRLVRGFKSSYRRMKWDKPAGTITMNSGVISSDVKGHPEQNRVLSLREILILSTLDHPCWSKKYTFDQIPYGRATQGQSFSGKLVREVIGESIPPLAMKKMVEHLLKLEKE
jgi:DNA (cytosine-5)-methyltransferase 1